MPGGTAAAVGFWESGFPAKAMYSMVSQEQKHTGWGHLNQASIKYSRPVCVRAAVLGQRHSGNVWNPYQGSYKSQAWQNDLTQASTQRQDHSGRPTVALG